MRIAQRFTMRRLGVRKFGLDGQPAPLIDLELLQDVGLLSVPRIYIERGGYLGSLTRREIDKFPSPDEFGRLMRLDIRNDLKSWNRIISSQSPVLFVFEDATVRLHNLVASLADVAVYANLSMNLGADAVKLAAKILSLESVVIAGLGLYRQSIDFFGKGEALEMVIELAARRPFEFAGYSTDHMREVLRWNKLFRS